MGRAILRQDEKEAVEKADAEEERSAVLPGENHTLVFWQTMTWMWPHGMRAEQWELKSRAHCLCLVPRALGCVVEDRSVDSFTRS